MNESRKQRKINYRRAMILGWYWWTYIYNDKDNDK